VGADGRYPRTLATPNAVVTTFTAPATGNLTFRLTVTDDTGKIGQDTVSVRVNSAPVLGAVANQTATSGDVLSFTVTATDADNDSITFAATNASTAPMSALGPTGQFTWNTAGVAAGNYTTGEIQGYSGAYSIAADPVTKVVDEVNTPGLLETYPGLANAFAGLGLGKGDRVAIYARNCLEWMEIYAACAKSGVVAVPVNFRLTAPEVRTIVEDCGAVVLLAGADLLDVVGSLRSVLPLRPAAYIQIGGERLQKGFRDYEDLLLDNPIFLERNL
jgi:non-ribosomal peptide synthetase component F